MNRSFVTSLFFAGALALAGASAFAASGGGGGGSSGAGTPQCKQGWVYNPQKGACEQKQSSNLDDETLYTQGRALALAGRYQEALDALTTVKAPDSMTLTMIGYSQRKMGNYDEGLDFYAKALVLDPNNANTREYLGEAYAEKGKLDLAKQELVKIEAICGTTCEQYEDLAKAIAGTPDES